MEIINIFLLDLKTIPFIKFHLHNHFPYTYCNTCGVTSDVNNLSTPSTAFNNVVNNVVDAVIFQKDDIVDNVSNF